MIRMHRSLHILWLALLLIEVSSTCAANPAHVKIEPQEHRFAIRQAILKCTPLGTDTNTVLRFVVECFRPKHDATLPKLEQHPADGTTAEASAKKGVQRVRLVLGHYMTNPILLTLQVPMIVETTTSVQWAFDKNGKLIEVFVDKHVELGAD
jgi:hypothetical protein